MAKATIGNILETSDNTLLKDLPLVSKALKMAGVLTPLRNNQTAKELLNQLRQNDPEVLGKTIPQILRPESKGIMHDCKSLMMWMTLITISLGITGANIYIALQNKTLIPWEDTIFSLLAPILVVLHDRGIVSRENRDTLASIAGMLPIPTLGEAIASRIMRGPQSGQRVKTATVLKEKDPKPATKPTDENSVDY